MFGSPHCGGAATPGGGGGAYLRGEREHAADDHLRRPCRERERAARPQHAQHLGDRDLGTRREHVAVLAEHDVELVVVERQLLGVSFVKVDRDLGDRRILARALQELGREVESRHARAEPCRRDRDDAGAAGDVEYAIAGFDARVSHELGRGRRRQQLERREVRPSFPLVLLEFIECVHWTSECCSTVATKNEKRIHVTRLLSSLAVRCASS